METSPLEISADMTVEEPQKTGHQVAALQRHCGTLTSVLQQLTDGGNGEQQEGLLTAGALSILDIKVGSSRVTCESLHAFGAGRHLSASG